MELLLLRPSLHSNSHFRLQPMASWLRHSQHADQPAFPPPAEEQCGFIADECEDQSGQLYDHIRAGVQHNSQCGDLCAGGEY